MFIDLGLTSQKVHEAEPTVVANDSPTVTWADIDEGADAELLMEGLRLDADPADVAVLEAAYARALEWDGTTSTR